MDTAMRDLEQIQERDYDDGPGRKIAMLGMAALATVGLVFAMGVLLGRSAETVAEPEPDPLAALDEALALPAGAPEDAEEEADPTVDPRELTFHDSLVGDERPEVAAAMAAAAAELAHLDPLPPAEDEGQGLAVGTFTTAVVPPPEAPEATAPALEVAPAGNLAMAPVAATAMEPRIAEAAEGSDGVYTLQVISYRTREEAEVFAEALRARGHAAFVQTAEVPERGTYHRVRIGPFETLRAAESYRADFEAQERMNTFVVHRRD
jgi:cell division septation protein DedD